MNQQINTDVSIFIPTRNRPLLLRRAIESVLRQTYEDFNFIVSHNGKPSADTIRVIEWAESEFPNLAFISHDPEIHGLEHFRLLVTSCTTPYILLLADDDWIGPNYLESCLTCLTHDASVVCATGPWLFRTQATSDFVDWEEATTYDSNSVAGRVFQFLRKREDSWFYSLSRREAWLDVDWELTWRTHKELPQRIAYPILLQLVMKGRFVRVFDRGSEWFNDDLALKTYQTQTSGSKLASFIFFVSREFDLALQFTQRIKNFPLPLSERLFLMASALTFASRDAILPVTRKLRLLALRVYRHLARGMG